MCVTTPKGFLLDMGKFIKPGMEAHASRAWKRRLTSLRSPSQTQNQSLFIRRYTTLEFGREIEPVIDWFLCAHVRVHTHICTYIYYTYILYMIDQYIDDELVDDR